MLTINKSHFTFKEGGLWAYVLCFVCFLLCVLHKKRATDESRTRDLFLTKEALYH